MSHTGGGSSPSLPCGACTSLRRKCTAECVFAPYFPADEALKVAYVQRNFEPSNVTKIMHDLPESSRADEVTSLAFEAEARMKDLAVSLTQRRIVELQGEIAELMEQVKYFEEKKRMRLTQGPSGTPNSS
ncbi:protein MpASLBD4 [Marchantia polymorpha subsp. ruderalis]